VAGRAPGCAAPRRGRGGGRQVRRSRSQRGEAPSGGVSRARRGRRGCGGRGGGAGGGAEGAAEPPGSARPRRPPHCFGAAARAARSQVGAETRPGPALRRTARGAAATHGGGPSGRPGRRASPRLGPPPHLHSSRPPSRARRPPGDRRERARPGPGPSGPATPASRGLGGTPERGAPGGG
jgi:hypothetical protein